MQHCGPYFAFAALRTHFIFSHPQSIIHNTNILIILGWIIDDSEMGLSRVTSFTMWVLVDFATPVDTDGRNTLYRNYGEKTDRENNWLLEKTDIVLRNTIEFILSSFKMTISLTTTNLPWEAVLCKKCNQKKHLGNLCVFFFLNVQFSFSTSNLMRYNYNFSWKLGAQLNILPLGLNFLEVE